MALAGPGYILTTGGGRLLQSNNSKGFRITKKYQPDLPSTVRLLKADGGLLLKSDTGGLKPSGITPEAAETVSTFDDEALFPPEVGRGSRGGPGYRSAVQETADGQEFRLSYWSRPVLRFDVASAVKTPEDLVEVLAFYRARQGPLRGFRFMDPHDWSTKPNHVGIPGTTDYRDRVLIGAGDGTATTFQLIKRYRFDVGGWGNGPAFEVIRPITRPWNPVQIGNWDLTQYYGVMHVWVDGVLQTGGIGNDYVVNFIGGQIIFSTAPAIGSMIEAAFTFHVPVQFGVELDSALLVNLEAAGSYRLRTLPIVEFQETAWFSNHRWYGGADDWSMSQNEWLNLGRGYVQKIDPTASGLTLYLPTPDDLIDGGPHVYLMNGQTAGGNTLRLATGDGNDTTVVTALQPQQYCVLWLRNDNTWKAFS